MNLGGELKALDAMNNSGLSMIRPTPGHVLRALDVVNNLGVWMT